MPEPLSDGVAPADAAASDRERVVGLLREEWSVLTALLESLSHDEWSRPALPGWDVHDVVAHLVGTERMLSGHEAPVALDKESWGEHVRNPIGGANEAWIVELRQRSHEELLDDFRQETGQRLATLEAMTVADFEAPSWTPVGDATYGRFMEVRVFDFWFHEQDIRLAVNRPGHEDGPVAEHTLDEVVGALGYIVGKRAGVPSGSSVTITLNGPMPRTLHVAVTDRARVVERLPEPATATLELPSTLFLRLAGGRVDPAAALGQVILSGDQELARTVATHLAYTI